MDGALTHPLRYRGALIAGGLLCLAAAATLGQAAQSPWYALGILAIGAVSLLRPDIGALLTVALSSPDLVASVEVGRFTIRVAQLSAATMTLGTCALLLGRGELVQTLRGLPRALWVFVGFAAVAMLRLLLLGASNPVKGFAYATWSLFVVAAVAGGLCITLDNPRRLGRVVTGMTLALALIACFGLLQWGVGATTGLALFTTQWMGTMPRINGLSYEPSYFAFSSMIGLVMALVFLLRDAPPMKPALAAAAAGVLIVAMTLSSSRSGWIGLAGVTLAFTVAALWRWRALAKARRLLLGAVPLALGVAALLLLTVQPTRYADMVRKGVDVDEQSSSAPRIEGVKQALEMFQSRPVVGVGMAQFGAELATRKGGGWSQRDIDAAVTFNLYIELLAETGLIGLTLIAIGLLLCLRSAWRAARSADPERATLGWALVAVGLVTFGVMYQFNQTLFRTDVWCLVGLCCAVERLGQGSEPS